MNCPRKIREQEAAAIDSTPLKEKEEIEELTILLEGRYATEDYLS
jgi:hypothetical protein